MTMEDREKIAITMGDPAGVGPEIIVKALSHVSVYQKCIPVVVGDKEALLDAIRFCNLPMELREIKDFEEAAGEFGTIDYINLGYLEPKSWEYKKIVQYAEKHLFSMWYMQYNKPWTVK